MSGIFTPELLMNIMSCHGFVNNTKSAVILSYYIKLIDYYLSKDLVLNENNSISLNNMPKRVKEKNQLRTHV